MTVELEGAPPVSEYAGIESVGAVSALAFDAGGALLAGTWRDGLLRLEVDGWGRRFVSEGPVHNYTTAVAPAPDGAVWMGTIGGVARFDGAAWLVQREADPASGDGYSCSYFITDQAICGTAPWVFRDVLPSPTGETWALTDAGLRIRQGEGWVGVPFESVTWGGDAPVFSVALGEDGEVWVGSWPTLFHGGLSGWTEIDGAPGLSYPHSIDVAPNGDVWVAASDPWEFNAGVARFDGDRWMTYLDMDDAVRYPSDLAIAADGTVWVAGINRVASFDGTFWTSYPAREHRALQGVMDLAVGSDGALWVASDTRGLSRFDGVAWTTWRTVDGLASNAVNRVSVVEDGTVWVGTAAGVQRIVIQ
jgi:ligand-binding sensor domain-containing protein